MRFFVFVPVGLVVVVLALLLQGLLIAAAIAAAIALPFGVVYCSWWFFRDASDSIGFDRAIKQMTAGTYVPEWQRKV